MMASSSSSSSSDLSNADHLLPQPDNYQLPCPWPSSSLPFPQHLHANIGLGAAGQWSHHLEQLSSNELEALLHSAQYYHQHSIQQQQQQLAIVPHSSSLLMMQDQLGSFQWTSCCSAALTADTAETPMLITTSQQQDALLLKEEDENQEEVDNRMIMRSTSAPATIVDAYSDSAAVVFPSVNVSLISVSDDGFDMSTLSSSSSPARLCRSHDAVLVHNAVPHPAPLLTSIEALSSIANSYSCKMGGAVASDSVSKNNGDDVHMNPSDEQQMQMQVATSTKKPRVDSTIVPSFKVRKEKLGDRIAALQQLVSPFGKTDTASVLMEAIGYIKFLQDQVETLSGPYMQRSSTRNKKPRTSTQQQQQQLGNTPAGDAGSNSSSKVVDLRSRGLCLVPLSCTSYVTNENAAAVVWPPPNFRGN